MINTNLTYASRCFISGWGCICKVLIKIQTKITNRTITFVNCKLTIWGRCISRWVIRISDVRTILTYTCSTGGCIKKTTYTKTYIITIFKSMYLYKIRGLMKESPDALAKILQSLPYFWNAKTPSVDFFRFILWYFFFWSTITETLTGPGLKLSNPKRNEKNNWTMGGKS